jgi:hypothetical protein
MVKNFIDFEMIQKGNKSKQAMQIIDHVVAVSVQISIHCMGVDNLGSQTLVYM